MAVSEAMILLLALLSRSVWLLAAPLHGVPVGGRAAVLSASPQEGNGSPREVTRRGGTLGPSI